MKKIILFFVILMNCATHLLAMHDLRKLCSIQPITYSLREFSQSSMLLAKNYQGFFSACTTKEEIKKKFCQEAKAAHPDHGGDCESFRNLKEEFEKMFKGTTTSSTQQTTAQSQTRSTHSSTNQQTYSSRYQRTQRNYNQWQKTADYSSSESDSDEEQYEYHHAWHRAQKAYYKWRKKWQHTQTRYQHQQRDWQQAQHKYHQLEKGWRKAQQRYEHAHKEFVNNTRKK